MPNLGRCAHGPPGPPRRWHLRAVPLSLLRPHNEDAERRGDRGVVGTCLQLLEQGATHIGVATDHVIESFRNDLWPTYKDGSGVDPDLKAQFPWSRRPWRRWFTVWPMVEVEADDALAAAADSRRPTTGSSGSVICTPDKDLGQCVGGKVSQWDRRQDKFRRRGSPWRSRCPPESIPDWLALVGDTADGSPASPAGAPSPPAAVLGHTATSRTSRPTRRLGRRRARRRQAGRHAAASGSSWRCCSGASPRSSATSARWVEVDAWRWTGPRSEFGAVAEQIGNPQLADRAAARGSAHELTAADSRPGPYSRSV